MKANLDEIISNSLKKTEEFEKKLKNIDEKFNLNSVSLTGDDDYAGKPPVSLLQRKYVSNLRTSPDLESGTTKLLLQLFT
jgi:hypothetical protein